MQRVQKLCIYPETYQTVEEVSRIHGFPLKGKKLKQFMLDQRLITKDGLPTTRMIRKGCMAYMPDLKMFNSRIVVENPEMQVMITNRGVVYLWRIITWHLREMNNEHVN